MAKLIVDDDFLAVLAATSPAAQQMVDELRSSHKRRGRPAASESQYRRLELWWKRFRRMNSRLTEEQAAKKFLRLRGETIAKELGLKRSTFHSLRMAVLRGEGESKRLRSHRAAQWQIVPTSLVDKVRTGADHRIVTDANEAILLRGAMRRALLGE
jgi:hypothetical protein